MKFHDFSAPIISSAITPDNQGIIVGSQDGDFRVWEPRMYQEPIVEFNVFKDTFNSPPPPTRFNNTTAKTSNLVHSIDIQANGQLISCAANDGYIRIFDVCGKKCLNQTRFTSTPQKPPTAMKFHSYKVLLGYGTDKTLSAFGAPN